MKKRKKKKHEETARPPKSVKTKFMQVLDDWKATSITIMDDKKHGHVAEYMLAPSGKVYRRAFAWENPHLVIDSPILPAEHHVRLIRIKDKKLKRQVKRAIRRRRSR